MKPLFCLSVLVSLLALSSFIIIADKAQVQTGCWDYLHHHIVTDSSFWTQDSKPCIEFIKHQAGGRRDKHRIALMFSKYPVAQGVYRMVPLVSQDDEVSVHIGDGIIDQSMLYWSSELNTGVLHVGMKDGKPFYWANEVLMEPWPRSAFPNAIDSFRVSFNLREF
jgi:hypothetical protein